MKLIFTNITRDARFSVSSKENPSDELPEFFLENHKDEIEEYLNLQKLQQEMVMKQKALLIKLKEDFSNEIKIHAPEYFL